MTNFFQVAPTFHDPFLDDAFLGEALERMMGESYLKITEDLRRFSLRVQNELEPLSQKAESRPPVHIPYGPWGQRVDQIEVSPAWERLHEIAAEEGIVAIGYERLLHEYSRLYQFSKLFLYHPSSAIYSCPLAMTDGAARVIELFGDQALKNKILPRLLSRDAKTFWTSGQWMTEKTGGSDVSGTSTTAKKEGNSYRLYGVKWFTSATTSQMAMALAKIEGEEKLSLFYVELRNSEGELQNIQINRLKEKMGTKALPTAELTLTGTPASLVGESGKGVKTISHLFNITRLYNACCAVGYMKKGISLIIDYSHKREAFGKKIIEHPLHAETLCEMQVRYEASLLMTLQGALLLGKEEVGKASETEVGVLRLLIPLAKLYTAKESISVISEVTEAFGGAGYIEDTGIPQLLRNTQVLSIWEGTTNVLSLDALRAIQKENAFSFFHTDVEKRAQKLKSPKLDLLRNELLISLTKVATWLKSVSPEDLNAEARNLAMNLSRIYCGSLLLEHADWCLSNGKSERSVIVCKRFFERGIFQKFLMNQDHRNETLEILKRK